MRLPLIAPANLTPEQKPLYDDMRHGIETSFKGFQAIAADGALIGPWNPWLHLPQFGGPVWDLVKALSRSPTLPKPVREVAILVTGTHFRSGYELYAHVLVAEFRDQRGRDIIGHGFFPRQVDWPLARANRRDFFIRQTAQLGHEDMGI